MRTPPDNHFAQFHSLGQVKHSTIANSKPDGIKWIGGFI